MSGRFLPFLKTITAFIAVSNLAACPFMLQDQHGGYTLFSDPYTELRPPTKGSRPEILYNSTKKALRDDRSGHDVLEELIYEYTKGLSKKDAMANLSKDGWTCGKWTCHYVSIARRSNWISAYYEGSFFSVAFLREHIERYQDIEAQVKNVQFTDS